jgi:hypothetical protein
LRMLEPVVTVSLWGIQVSCRIAGFCSVDFV